ncbi:hypothetical protein ACFQY7_06325 [Actinomadura luteofluorescens]|uniref:hypothetical protein n=1 Tax=Actinomadura luteofluorescens TaxID=46163 RepID=UPI0036454DB7
MLDGRDVQSTVCGGRVVAPWFLLLSVRRPQDRLGRLRGGAPAEIICCMVSSRATSAGV